MDKFLEHTQQVDGNKLEIRRLSGQHEVMLKAMGKAVYAPVDLSKPDLRVLDSACADGLWMVDVRKTSSPKSQFVGFDIVGSLFPPNPPERISFKEHSFMDPFPTDWQNSFDLVHQRFALAGAGSFPLRKVIDNLVSLLKPGGYLQLIEMDTNCEHESGPMWKSFITLMADVFEGIGAGRNFATTLRNLMKEAGLQDVEERIVLARFGAKLDDKDLIEKSILSPVGAIGPLTHMTEVVKTSLTKEELADLGEKLRKELETEGAVHAIHVIWGRKL